jgi:MFS family permease
MPPAQDFTADRPLAPAVSVPGALVRHRTALAVLVLAALSFVLPSAPTYDPWAWIVWGREVLHLDLTTVDGPSWKPLPMLVTPVFALAGGLAPDLWLFVARAAALASVVVVFRLVRRLGGGTVGATAAAVAYALAPWTIRNGMMGNSEGLLVACALGAAERHLAGHRRQAFALGVAAGLLRPEAWPFLGLYGLWLAWRMPAARVLVAAGFASLPLLWLLPELWGSGDLLRAMHRAQEPVPGSPGSSDTPVSAVLDRFQTMLTTSIWVGLAALVLALVLRRRRAAQGGEASRETRATLALVAAGVVLVAEVAFMASGGGFTGGTRYLILPAAVVIALAGTGLGWAVRAALGGRRPPRVAALALVALAALAFAAPSLARFTQTVRAARDQARLSDDLANAVQRAGGRHRLLACGDPYTGPFEVPKVAWLLHVHTHQVALQPRAPAVIFTTRADTPLSPMPRLEGVEGAAGARTLALTRYWRIIGICRPGGAAR